MNTNKKIIISIGVFLVSLNICFATPLITKDWISPETQEDINKIGDETLRYLTQRSVESIATLDKSKAYSMEVVGYVLSEEKNSKVIVAFTIKRFRFPTWAQEEMVEEVLRVKEMKYFYEAIVLAMQDSDINLKFLLEDPNNNGDNKKLLRYYVVELEMNVQYEKYASGALKGPSDYEKYNCLNVRRLYPTTEEIVVRPQPQKTNIYHMLKQSLTACMVLNTRESLKQLAEYGWFYMKLPSAGSLNR